MHSRKPADPERMVIKLIIMPWQLRSIADCLNRSFFSKDEKVDYIDAVLCLQSTPSKTPADLVPGARSRYDDFVATHINQTLQIHYTVWSYSYLFGEPRIMLTITRAPSSHGIDGSSGNSNRPCAMNAAIREPYRESKSSPTSPTPKEHEHEQGTYTI